MSTFIVLDSVCFIFHCLFLLWSVIFDNISKEDLMYGVLFSTFCFMWPAYVTLMALYLMYRFYIHLWHKYNRY